MVQKLDVVKESALKVNVYELNLHPGDTLVLQFDLEIFDIDEVQQMLKVWVKAYPQNKVIATFKGMEVKGVIHEDFKCSETFSHSM